MRSFAIAALVAIIAATGAVAGPVGKAAISCVEGFECPQYDVLETFDDIELRRYPAGVWVSRNERMSDYHFLVEYGYEYLAKYFLGDNYEGSALTMTSPLKVDLNIWRMDHATVSFMLPQEKKGSPPTPKFPTFLRATHEEFMYVRKVNTTFDIRSINHLAAVMMSDLSIDKQPFDMTRVSIFLYTFPPSPKPAPATEIMVPMMLGNTFNDAMAETNVLAAKDRLKNMLTEIKED